MSLRWRHYRSWRCRKESRERMSDEVKRKALKTPTLEGDMVGADCSKCGQQQQGRPDRRQLTAVYDGHSVTVGKQMEGVSGP